VKFNDPATGLECDINVNDQLGYINTSMIKHYVSLQPVLIPLLRLIKRWAKTVGMNSPSKRPASFSSYAFTLMTIGWFQVRSLIRSSSSHQLSSVQVIRIATKPSGGCVRQGCCPNGLLLDKEQKRREIPMRYSIHGSGNPTGGRGKTNRRVIFRVAQACSLWHPFIRCPLTNHRFWGQEFEYDKAVVCISRGGIIPRKGKSALKDPNPVASTSKQHEEQELLDDEQDEEADEAAPDESFDADWSGNLICVADPFIVAKVKVFPLLR